jgi:hypothetical protein
MSLRRRLLHEKIEKAEEKNDTKEMDALVAKLDSLEQQVGPDYIRVTDGLGDVDPSSAEGPEVHCCIGATAQAMQIAADDYHRPIGSHL